MTANFSPKSCHYTCLSECLIKYYTEGVALPEIKVKEIKMFERWRIL